MKRRSASSSATEASDGNPKTSAAAVRACQYCQDPERYDVDPAKPLPVGFSYFNLPSDQPVIAHRTRHPAGGVEVLLLCQDQGEVQP